MTSPISPALRAVELFNEALGSLGQSPLEVNQRFRHLADGLPGQVTVELSNGTAPLRFTFDDFAFQVDVSPLAEVAVVPADRFDDPDTGVVATARQFLTSKLRIDSRWGGRIARVQTIDEGGSITSEYKSISIGGGLGREDPHIEYGPALSRGL